MGIGNDIVDLRDPEARPDATHPRFDLRVFTAAERERLAEAVSPERLRWALWAAKESAFKAARKLEPSVPFHPRRFAVRLLGPSRAEVVHRMLGRFDVWIDEAREWVHALALPSGENLSLTPPAFLLDILDSDSPDDGASPGERVRELARRAVAPLLAVDPSDLEIVRGPDGIPVLRRAGDPAPVDLSLSHHGRFVACAWSESAG